MNDKKKLIEEDLEKVAGGGSYSPMPSIIYCMCCGFEELCGCEKTAKTRMEQLYINQCPHCGEPLGIK